MTHRRTTRIGALTLVALAGIQTLSAQPIGNLVWVMPRFNPGEPFRFIGGRTVTVPLSIHGPRPEGLMVWAELIQISSSLAVPVGGQVNIPVAVSARADTGFTSELELSLSLPVVTRETDFELRFQASWPPARAMPSAGRIALRVYPGNLLDPVRIWAASHPIWLEDDQGSTRERFRELRIPVATQPGPSGVTVYAGAGAVQKYLRVPPRHGQSAILLLERDTATPHLVVDRTSGRTTVKVEMNLLDRLATDPLAQKIFLEAFQHAVLHDEAAPRQGVVR
jgi:hypothetical protein